MRAPKSATPTLEQFGLGLSPKLRARSGTVPVDTSEYRLRTVRLHARSFVAEEVFLWQLEP